MLSWLFGERLFFKDSWTEAPLQKRFFSRQMYKTKPGCLGGWLFSEVQKEKNITVFYTWTAELIKYLSITGFDGFDEDGFLWVHLRGTLVFRVGFWNTSPRVLSGILMRLLFIIQDVSNPVIIPSTPVTKQVVQSGLICCWFRRICALCWRV